MFHRLQELIFGKSWILRKVSTKMNCSLKCDFHEYHLQKGLGRVVTSRECELFRSAEFDSVSTMRLPSMSTGRESQERAETEPWHVPCEALQHPTCLISGAPRLHTGLSVGLEHPKEVQVVSREQRCTAEQGEVGDGGQGEVEYGKLVRFALWSTTWERRYLPCDSLSFLEHFQTNLFFSAGRCAVDRSPTCCAQ